MNKQTFKAFLFTFLITSFSTIFADFYSTADIRGAAFFPISERFRQIYGDVVGSYQLEASTNVYDSLDLWANLDWVPKSGHSIGFHDSTKINIVNESIGLKYHYQLTEHFRIYFGMGPTLAQIWIKDTSFCGHKSSSFKCGVGGVVKSGICYFFDNRFFIEIFADYLYQPVHFEHQVDIGGFKVGGGIGFSF